MYKIWKIYIFFASFQIFLQTADLGPPRIDHVVRLPSIGPREQNTTLERTFNALEGLLDFYQREYKNLIIDGVFGLRVLEGVAKKVLTNDQRGNLMLPSEIRKRVQNLYTRSIKISNMSIYYLEKQDPQYFEVMGFVALEPWKNIHSWRNLDLNKKVPQSAANMDDNKIKMEESDQDQCIRSLAGDRKKGIKPCTISEDCWKVNTVQGKSKYFLTHQLLFFMMGEDKGCLKVFEAKLKSDSFQGGVDQFFYRNCRLMYPEMLRLEKIAVERKYLEDIDLYMEQCVVCGMLGYAEFFSLRRLNLILGWIHPRKGCFGYSENIKREPSDENEEEEEKVKSDRNKKAMRQLKFVKDLKGGCEVHSSGVGTGLLANYLRWLLHISRFTKHEINPEGYDKAGFFIKHKYLGVIPSAKTTLMFLFIAILVLIVLAKRLGFGMPKTVWF